MLTYFSDDEGVERLISDMLAGDVPPECEILCGQSNGASRIPVDDKETIRQLYDLVVTITVDNASSVAPTMGDYHQIRFLLRDGTKVEFSFDGEGCVSHGERSVAVTRDDYLRDYVSWMRDEQAQKR